MLMKKLSGNIFKANLRTEGEREEHQAVESVLKFILSRIKFYTFFL
jgi:hypothetical protein